MNANIDLSAALVQSSNQAENGLNSTVLCARLSSLQIGPGWCFKLAAHFQPILVADIEFLFAASAAAAYLGPTLITSNYALKSINDGQAQVELAGRTGLPNGYDFEQQLTKLQHICANRFRPLQAPKTFTT